MLFSGVPRRGCVIQRSPGDKVMVEKRNEQYIIGCAHVGGGDIYKGGVRSSFRVIRYTTLLASVLRMDDGV